MPLVTSLDMSKVMVESIHNAIQSSVNKIAEEEIESAKKRIEERVKHEVGAIAISVMKQAQIRTIGDMLVIEIKMGDLNKR